MTSEGAVGLFEHFFFFDVSHCQRFCCQEQILQTRAPLALRHFTKPRICSFSLSEQSLNHVFRGRKRGERHGVCVCVQECLSIINVRKDSFERKTAAYWTRVRSFRPSERVRKDVRKKFCMSVHVRVSVCSWILTQRWTGLQQTAG